MLIDAADLVAFYRTPLGKMARRLIGARLRSTWSHTQGLTIVGHGYAVSYLEQFRDAHQLVGVMPAAQGAVRWPRERPSRVVLAENDSIPLPDASVDRVLAVHSLENATDPRRQLREFWRVLKGDGRAIILVPNRRGVWARFDATPFGSGRPYSRTQLERLLTDALFQPTGWSGSLFAPPLNSRIAIRSAIGLERIGGRYWPGVAGVVMVEATKELMAPIIRGEGARSTKGARAAAGLGSLKPASRHPNRRTATGAPIR